MRAAILVVGSVALAVIIYIIAKISREKRGLFIKYIKK